MSKTQGNFKLRVVEGEFTDSQIVVMLGENGTGKTTFIRMLVFFLVLVCVLYRLWILKLLISSVLVFK